MSYFDAQTKRIILCVVVYALASIPVFLLTANFLHLMLVWNVFLATLPCIFAQLLPAVHRTSKVGAVILSLLWLFFFPNALYIVTDFIHISGTEFYWREGPYSPVTYATDIVAWTKLVHIGIGVFLGALAGLLSLYKIHQLLRQKKGKIISIIAVALVCLLSGYAIYIGRFLRFNSWDILRPFSLLSELASHTDSFALSFSWLFAKYILAVYGIFYAVYHQRTSPL